MAKTKEEIEKELCVKYNFFVLENGIRIYRIFSPNRTITVSDSRPWSLYIPGEPIIQASSWSDLYYQVVEFAIKKGVSKEWLLSLEYGDRTKATLFSKTKLLANMKLLSNDLYLSIFDADLTYLAMLDFLRAIKINVEKCYLLVYKTPYSEYGEVCDFYEKNTRNKFNNWLIRKKKYSLNNALAIIKIISNENKLLSSITKSYGNFFLLPTRRIMATLKSKYLKKAKMEYIFNAKKYEAILKCLNILTEFYSDFLPADWYG